MRGPLMPDSHRALAFLSLEGRQMIELLREAADEWVADKAPRLSAALAYYTLLSLAPLLVVAVAVAALAFSRTAVEGQLFWEIRDLVGSEGATAVQGLLRNASRPAS